MRIDVITGNEARELLNQEAFLAQWEALCARCPWATAFQSHRYARVWYGTYPDTFTPVLVVGRDERHGELRALLTLALATVDGPLVAKGSLIVAGGDQAEYHTWVCTPEDGDVFPVRAFRALRQSFPTSRLLFRYMAPATPLKWLQSPDGRRYCVIKPYRRPLLALGDGSAINQSLKKSGNKSRLKRLEKLGGFEFRRVTDLAEYESLFDRIVSLYDLRHGAIQGSDPFCTIPRQKAFHVAMMKAGLLHATVMKVRGELAAAHWGVVTGRELQLGTIVHDPLLAKHSPGKFQVLLLARMLSQEGFARFDLTPGGDTYKERFANDADQAHAMLVLPTPAACARARVKWRAIELTKSWLGHHGLTPAEARFRVRQLRQPLAVARRLVQAAREWAWSSREVHVFVRDTAEPVPGRAGVTLRRDAVEDLLRYDATAAGGLESRQTFLARSLRRLEAGQHCYTVADEGHLRCCVWLDAQPGPGLEDVGELPGVAVPPNSVVIHDHRTFGPAGEAPSEADVLRAVMADAAVLLPDVGRAVLVVQGSDDQPLSQAARRLGFAPASTLLGVARFGRIVWTGVHRRNELLPRRPTAADLTADEVRAAGPSKRLEPEEIETAGAV